MIFNSSEVWVWWQNSFEMKFNSLLIQLCRFYPSSKGKLRLGVIFLCQAFIIALHWPRKRQRQPRSPSTLYLIFDSSTRKWSAERWNKVLREGSGYQIGWIFGKIPNGLWPLPPHFRKIILQIFYDGQGCIYARRYEDPIVWIW